MRTETRIVTARTSARGRISVGGSSSAAAASTPKATTAMTTTVKVTPTAMPRSEKRETSVTSGSTNHAIVEVSAPPVSTTLTPMMTCDTHQATNSPYSGRSERSA